MELRHSNFILFLATFSIFWANSVFAQTLPDERDSQPPTGPMPFVQSIELLDVSGEFVDASFEFFPVGSSGAHLSLATGQIDEIVRDPRDPQPPMTGKPNQILWWDLDLKVTVSPNDIDTATGRPREPVMLAIDKDVINQTRFHWTDFHMTLGMRRPDGSFMESDEFDFLFFKDDPPPMEKQGLFENPPMKDEPVAPDNLWWFWNPGKGFPGVKPGDLAIFWMGIQIPPHKFENGMARFVLREHASIPEPATLALLASSGIALLLRRRLV